MNVLMSMTMQRQYKDVVRLYLKQLFEKLLLRFEQELMVLRYVLFCRPSLRTVVVLALRLVIIGASFLVFASIQLSVQFLQDPLLNVGLLFGFLLLVVTFVWEFGYTLAHIRKYGLILTTLMLIPLPLYVIVYAQTPEESSSKVELVTHGFSDSRSSSEYASQTNARSWYRLQLAQVGGLSVSYQTKKSKLADSVDESLIEPAITELPLPYPNPFKASLGCTLGYGLSKNMDIDIQIYNMFGHLVQKMTILSGEEGGKRGYNRLEVSGKDATGADYAAGGYFIFILNEGKVLSKGKMAVIP